MKPLLRYAKCLMLPNNNPDGLNLQPIFCEVPKIYTLPLQPTILPDKEEALVIF